MATYFDKREGRERPIPDCSKVGLVWDPETQRCEKMSTINSLLMAANLLTKANPQPAENQGMGFLAWEGDYYDDWEYDYYWDDWGWSDYSSGGELPIYDYDFGQYGYDLGDPGISAGDPYDRGIDWASFWDSFFSGGDLYVPSPGDEFLQTSNSSVSNDPWLPDNFWDWLTDTVSSIPGTAPSDPALPGYCPQGTYHPIDNPMACVPFPADPAGNQAAQQQRKKQQQAAQKAAQAAKAAQKKQDQACPKDAQGKPQWKNPQTGKCEPIPACPQGMVFDSTSRRCLTPQQVKEVYGDNNWLIWALIALGVLVVIKK